MAVTEEQVDIDLNTEQANVLSINGTINVIRLEGEIANIKKVYYFYTIYEYEDPLNKQRQCDDIYSVDIEKHFADKIIGLQNSSKIYDFYIENLDNFQINDETLNAKQQYALEIKKFFYKILSDREHNISMSQLFKNIKCHYLDTKEFDLKSDIINFNSVYTILRTDYIYQMYNIENLNAVVNVLSNLKYKLNDLFLEMSLHDDKMYNKLHNKYKKAEVEKSGNDLLAEFSTKCKKCVVEVDNTIKYVVNFSAEYDDLLDNNILRQYKNTHFYIADHLTLHEKYKYVIESCVKINRDLRNISTTLEVAIMNRRFNDSGCTNIVIVASNRFIHKYIELLIKTYNFTLTNNSLNNPLNHDLVTVNALLKKLDVSRYSRYLLPENYTSCSKLIGMPALFD